MLPRRHASIDVLWLTVLFTSTAILAVAVIHRPFTIKVARQHEKPLHLLFQQCCKILWTEPNVQRNKEFPLRERKWIGRQPLIIPRGGGQQQPETDILAAQQHVIPITSLPLIDTKSVSLALRLTCETNRRLHRGTSITAGATTDFLSKHHTLGQHVPQHRMSPTLCTHTIRSVPESEQIEERRVEELTLFHCMDLGYRLVDEKTPQSGSSNGNLSHVALIWNHILTHCSVQSESTKTIQKVATDLLRLEQSLTTSNPWKMNHKSFYLSQFYISIDLHP